MIFLSTFHYKYPPKNAIFETYFRATSKSEYLIKLGFLQFWFKALIRSRYTLHFILLISTSVDEFHTFSRSATYFLSSAQKKGLITSAILLGTEFGTAAPGMVKLFIAPQREEKMQNSFTNRKR